MTGEEAKREAAAQAHIPLQRGVDIAAAQDSVDTEEPRQPSTRGGKGSPWVPVRPELWDTDLRELLESADAA
jgi:hypothetical protein